VPEQSISFGGSTFIGCSVPLAFESRYFILEPGTKDEPLVSVIRDDDGEPVFEVFRNEPGNAPMTTSSKTPPGIVTVGAADGSFLYKVRPGSETSVVFGTLKGEVEAKITDKKIQVGGILIENCTFAGVGAGVVVSADGSVGIGAPIPESLRAILPSG
jgi:hypothetical protein